MVSESSSAARFRLPVMLFQSRRASFVGDGACDCAAAVDTTRGIAAAARSLFSIGRWDGRLVVAGSPKLAPRHAVSQWTSRLSLLWRTSREAAQIRAPTQT